MPSYLMWGRFVLFFLRRRSQSQQEKRTAKWSQQGEKSQYAFWLPPSPMQKKYRGILWRDQHSRASQWKPKPYWKPPQGLDNRKHYWRDAGSLKIPEEMRTQETQRVPKALKTQKEQGLRAEKVSGQKDGASFSSSSIFQYFSKKLGQQKTVNVAEWPLKHSRCTKTGSMKHEERGEYIKIKQETIN